MALLLLLIVYHIFRMYDNRFELGYTVSGGGIYKFAFYWGCLGNVVITLVEAKFLIITFKIILQVLEMDMAVSAIIE